MQIIIIVADLFILQQLKFQPADNIFRTFFAMLYRMAGGRSIFPRSLFRLVAATQCTF
jgi:hypothetical protein